MAKAGFRVALRAHRAEADGEAVESAFRQQRADLAAALRVGDETATDIKPARVLADDLPDADGLMREVLVEHAHFRRPAARERCGEGALLHDVAGGVGHAEERGVTFKLVVRQRGDARRRGELRETPRLALDER